VDRRVAAAVLGFVAAAMLLPALFTKGWWKGEKREDSEYGGSSYGGKVVATLAVGALGVEFCNRDFDSDGGGMKCKSFSYGEAPARGPFGTWRTLGKVMIAGGLATAAAMVLLGVFALQRKRLPIGVLAGPVLGGAAFLILWLAWNQSLGGGGENLMEISPGYGFFLAFLGYGAATAATWLFAGLPAAPAVAVPALPAAQAAAAVPPLPALGAQACPRCRAPLSFVAQYNRWYCNACQQYV
jgi:hypothetical protein